MALRRIIYRPEFDKDTLSFGGIAAVQKVIAPLVEALERKAEAFDLLEVGSNRHYAPIKAVDNMPALLVVFSIDAEGDVVMELLKRR